MSIVTVLADEVTRQRARARNKQQRILELRRQRDNWKARAQANARDAARWRAWRKAA